MWQRKEVTIASTDLSIIGVVPKVLEHLLKILDYPFFYNNQNSKVRSVKYLQHFKEISTTVGHLANADGLEIGNRNV